MLNLQNPVQILRNLYLSSIQPEQDLTLLKQLQVNFILNLTACKHNSNELRFKIDYPSDITVKHIKIADEMNIKLCDYLNEALDFIHQSIGNNTSNKILIHCEAGISHSPSIVLAYLMKCHNQSLKTAYDYVKQWKNNIGPNANFFEELIQFKQQQQLNITNNENFKPSISLHDYLVQQLSEGPAAKFNRDQISSALDKTKNQPDLALNFLYK